MRIAIHDFGGHPFVFELSRELAQQGHQVGHFFFADYPGPKGASERVDADPATLTISPIQIGQSYSTQRLGSRLRGNLAYAAKASAAIRRFKPDVVLSGNTPTEIQGSLIQAARLTGAKFIYWMQDFYSLAVSSLIGQRWFGLGRIVGATYKLLDLRHLRQSDGIVLISDSFREEVKTLGKLKTPMWTIPNWGAIADINVVPKDNEWSAMFGLSDRFVALYSGTLGLKHDPLLLVHLAQALQQEGDGLLVVAAQGAGRAVLEDCLRMKPQANLLLLDLQPIASLAKMLGSADVFVALLEAEAARFSVPSKILSYLCAGRPIVLSASPENLACQVLKEAEAGIAVDAGKPADLCAAVLEFHRNKVSAREAGQSGRRYAEKEFNIASIASRFVDVFQAPSAQQK